MAGAATRVINPAIGDDLAGQLHRRICGRVRDDLEANALYLARGETRVLLFSLDLLGYFQDDADVALARAVAEAAGMDARDVVVSCTHTHAGPETPGSLLADVPKNHAYLEKLTTALVDCAREAKDAAHPAAAAWAAGRAHIGYNRRLTWADGSASMYGDASRPDFSGLEGPDDPSHAVLHVTTPEGGTVAVVHNNCCHSTVLEGDTYSSADYPGEARRLVRTGLGDDVPVLYLNGACGDVAPWNMLEGKRPERATRLEQVGRSLADETLRLVADAKPRRDAELAHISEDVSVGVRLPTDEELRRAEEVKALGEEKAGRWEYVLSAWGVLKLQELFAADPTDVLTLHALRVGDCMIATNPCELFCRYGLDIKRRSPAPVTMVSELTAGAKGYCPTPAAIAGGGYSGYVNAWCRLEPEAGRMVVERTASMLDRLWQR